MGHLHPTFHECFAGSVLVVRDGFVSCGSGSTATVNTQKAPTRSTPATRCAPRPPACGAYVVGVRRACRPFQSTHLRRLVDQLRRGGLKGATGFGKTAAVSTAGANGVSDEGRNKALDRSQSGLSDSAKSHLPKTLDVSIVSENYVKIN